MAKVLVDTGKLPTKIARLANKLGAVDNDLNVWMDADPKDGGWVIYAKDKKHKKIETQGIVPEDWMYPAVLLLRNGNGEYKPYGVLEHPAPGLDASALEEYQEIILRARADEDKDAETCRAINLIHDQFVIFLACMNYANIGSEEHKRSRRGRIQAAKYTAVRIWREGKPKPIEPVKESSHE
jgi:hypothetical protein